MARTITEIYEEIKDEADRLATERENDDVTNMLTNTSKFALWRLFFYIMAFAVWSLENIFDKFKALVDSIIAAKVPHHLRWYRTKALAFQFGFDLLPESDQFDNTGKSAEEIAASKIIKYAAVNETTLDGKRVLLIKIAGVDGSGNLTQLSDEQAAAFEAYMQMIKDAGNLLVIYNRQADTLKTIVDVYYNALLLDESGIRLDGLGGKPVEEAAKAYLLELPFNGEFSNAAFVDKLQAAYGVSGNNVFISSMQRKIGIGAYQAVVNTFIPEAGYVAFDTDNGLTINYIPHV